MSSDRKRTKPMKNFNCPQCQQPLYFGNRSCLACGLHVVFDPESLTMVPQSAQAPLCSNGEAYGVCNWRGATGAIGTAGSRCLACSANEQIPDLSIAGNTERWRQIEAAKRHLYYELLSLSLGHALGQTVQPPLRFVFNASTHEEKVVTGHDYGTITIDIAESEDDIRARRRQQLGEGYRTLLGHFRHEVGHYLWLILIAARGQQETYRTLFGDERLDYGQALNSHYENGAPADWQANYISAYASSHPHEDWAESFAHYLHMQDALETGYSRGLLQGMSVRQMPFSDRVVSWQRFSIDLNVLARSMGFRDMYPFVFSARAIAKLQAIDQAVGNYAAGG